MTITLCLQFACVSAKYFELRTPILFLCATEYSTPLLLTLSTAVCTRFMRVAYGRRCSSAVLRAVGDSDVPALRVDRTIKSDTI